MKCIKCGAVSGDDWRQCKGSCPLSQSPHYDPQLLVKAEISAEAETFKRILEICRKEDLTLNLWYAPSCNESDMSVQGIAVSKTKGPEDFYAKSKAGLTPSLEYMKEKLEAYYSPDPN
jgi:hypothetical protein